MQVRPVEIQVNQLMLSNYILALLKYMLELLKNKLVLIKINMYFDKKQRVFQQLSTCMLRNTTPNTPSALLTL